MSATCAAQRYEGLTMPQTIKGQPIDQRTENLRLPMPHPSNWQEDDLQRLRTALQMIDTAMQLMALDMDSRDHDLSTRAAALEGRAALLEGRASLLEYAAGRPSAVTYGYDAQGRVNSITQTVAGAQRTTALTYDSQGRVATAAYPVAGGSNRTDTYNYDAGTGRLASVNSVEAKP
ncbi:RHS repeat protein [Acidovorax phage Acica]|nr:RHS repeat protein [Acidovorax phage Acica]